MKRALQHVLLRGCVLFLVVCLLAALPASAHIAQSAGRVVRVGVAQVDGYSYIDENGCWQGLIIDYLNEIAKYTGWEYDYIEARGDILVEGLINGDYEVIGGTYYIAGLESMFAYPNYSIGHDKSVLLARRDDHDIRSYELSDLNGKRIGVLKKATENIRRLEEYLRINAVECQLRYYTREETEDKSLIDYLLQGDVDLILGNSADRSEALRVVTSFDAQPHYIVTRPDCPDILEGLNMALERIVDSNPNFTQERYNANLFSSGTPDVFLNAEEQAYIREKGVVTVAVPTVHHPMYCVDEPGDFHDGITVNILSEIEKFSGLKFQYVYAESYQESLEMVLQGQADMAGFFLDGEAVAVEMGLALTKAYVSLDNAVVRNKSVGYPGEGLSCAVLEGRVLPAHIQAETLHPYTDVTQALLAVNRGDVDFAYGMSAQLEQVIQQQYLSNVTPVFLLEETSDISFALPKPAPIHLLTILNKSIVQMSAEERMAIANRNVASLGINPFSLRGLIYSNPQLFVGGISLLLSLIVLVVLVSARAKVRAAVMQSELERAEAESRARGIFLSRMSHEIRTPMNAVVGLADLTGMMADVPEEIRENLSKIRSSSRYLLNLINDILDMSSIDNGMLSVSSEPFALTVVLDELCSMMGAEAARRSLIFETQINIVHDGLTGDAIRLRQVLTNLLSNACKFTPAGGHIWLRAVETRSDQAGASFRFAVQDTGVGVPEEDRDRIFNAFEQVGAGQMRSQGTGLGLPISRSIVSLMGGELSLSSHPGGGSEFYFELTLPYGTPDKPAQRHAGGADLLSGARILLVEDNDLNAEIATQLLEMQGAQVARARDGRQAVNLFDASPPGEIDVILMDLQMPVMDGLEATKAIRAMARPDAATVPIFAMTANTFKADTDAAAQAGMNDFIAKPLDVNYLFGALHRALKKD